VIAKSNNQFIAELPKYNFDTDRITYLKDNTNKSGIYMFKNFINDKRYIASSENLKRRFICYLNTNHLLKNTCMNICRAFLKYGSSKFSLEILEYCEAEQCLKREDFYLSSLNPEYNINQKSTAPFSGRTHSD
jgi:group I intron endonuclease